jgi:DHA3 family macrolide efflux protein-like MFS transporter
MAGPVFHHLDGPILVSEHFGGDAAQLSLLDSMAGVGIVVGGIALSVWGGFQRKIVTTMMAMTVLGLGFIVVGLTPGSLFWLALASVFVIGLTIPLIDGPIMAILQGTVAPEIQGRVFTLMGSLLGLTSPFSLAVAGPVSDWLGLQVWYLAAGVLCSVIGVTSFFVPALMNIEKNQNGHAERSELSSEAVAEAAAATD